MTDETKDALAKAAAALAIFVIVAMAAVTGVLCARWFVEGQPDLQATTTQPAGPLVTATFDELVVELMARADNLVLYADGNAYISPTVSRQIRDGTWAGMPLLRIKVPWETACPTPIDMRPGDTDAAVRKWILGGQSQSFGDATFDELWDALEGRCKVLTQSVPGMSNPGHRRLFEKSLERCSLLPSMKAKHDAAIPLNMDGPLTQTDGER